MTRLRSNSNNPEALSRAAKRRAAFIAPRLAQPGKQELRRSLLLPGKAGETPTGEALSPALHRLQQLQQFRQRQQTETIQTRREVLPGRRDLAVPDQLNWVPLGPFGVEQGQASTTPLVSGRVKGIAVAPGGNRVYVATANGGVWYSGDRGKTWRPLFDQFNFFPTELGSQGDTDSLACGAIALVAGAGNTSDKIFVGTGEGDGMTDAYLGVGPLVSSDGGKTWVRETASPTLVGQGFYALAIDPDDPERVIAGTSDGVYVREPNGAGGYEWKRKGLANLRVTGLVVTKGAAGKRYYAAVWGDKVYTSTTGNNWGAAGIDFPTNRIGRITVGAHPGTPELVYALIAFGGPEPAAANLTDADPKNGHFHGLYHLDTRINNKWRPVNAAALKALFGPGRVATGSQPAKSGQGDYDNVIIVSPNNENRIFVAGSAVLVSSEWSASLYRCDIQVVTAAGVTTATAATSDLIGSAAHPDVHALTITPDEPEQLWVGCDGGVFFTQQASGSGNILESKNAGLQTLTMNHLGPHPTEEEIFFCSAQDNGCLRYFGSDVWFHSFPGDSGYCLINWKKLNEVLVTYTDFLIFHSDQFGNRAPGVGYNKTNRPIPAQKDAAGDVVEQVNFYAPLVNVPFKTGLPDAQADMAAFGTDRPWISTDFGQNWFPLPSRTPNDLAKYNSDKGLLGGVLIDSLAFADSKNLLVGLSNGRIYKYTDNSAANDWTSVSNPPDRLDTDPGGGSLPAVTVTDIAVNPANTAQFYVSFGGILGHHKHIWFYDGAAWHDRSGSGANTLLDVQFSAVAINPDNVNQLFGGSDVGVWKSEDGGVNWSPFSNGLPETAVIDMHITSRDLGGGKKLNLLRASTYGRGVFECNLSAKDAANVSKTPVVQLFLRKNILDRGRYPGRQNVTDPRNLPAKIPDLDTPDIKIDVPTATGLYQFSANETLSPGQFNLTLTDKSNQIPVPAAGAIVSRVYVQVHSNGMFSANNVRVMLMVKELAGAALPDLPTNYDPDVRAGIPINREGWKTIGIRMVHGVMAGEPRVVAVDLPSGLLPAHGTLGGGGKDLALAVLLHAPQTDEYTATVRVLNPATANNVTLAEPKITVKQIKAIQSAAIPTFAVRAPLSGYVAIPATATAPEAPYDAFLGQAFRLNDSLFNQLGMARFAQPLSNRGTDGVLTNPDTKSMVVADTITVDTDTALQAGVPLIWFARKKITISKTINAKGQGAPRTTDGDFGGGGGGGVGSAGKKCSLPQTNPAIDIAAGGAVGANTGAALDPAWASRALFMLPFCKGGGAGGDDGANLGGLGGGVVVLCAPVIEFAAGGKIDASGANGAGNAGGGGGGLVVLIAGETPGLSAAGPNPNVVVTSGTSAGSGGAGGAGLLLRKVIQ